MSAVRYQGVGSISFIGKLQRLHMTRLPVHLWKDGLKEIAKDEGHRSKLLVFNIRSNNAT